MEEKSLALGEQRIKFSCTRIGAITDVINSEDKKLKYFQAAKNLADVLHKQELYGFSPMAPDGKIGGNGATVIELDDNTYVLVSKSGKDPGELDPLESMCLIKTFDKDKWSCDYYSQSPDTKPTSDTPMHFCLLKLQDQLSLEEYPTFAVHGHALATEDEAKKFHLPYSRETMFSTPEDTQVMLEMLAQNKYPTDKVFVRLNHGYYLLATDYNDCCDVFMKKIVGHAIEACDADGEDQFDEKKATAGEEETQKKKKVVQKSRRVTRKRKCKAGSELMSTRLRKVRKTKMFKTK